MNLPSFPNVELTRAAGRAPLGVAACPAVADPGEPDDMTNTESAEEERTTPGGARTNLALQRTVIAAERTLMAWIRTAISMISFGFTIDKFFEYFPSDVGKGNIRHPMAPRNLGLSLVALGTLALAAAALQHRHFLKQLGATGGRLWSITFVVALVVVLIGLLAFYGVWLRHGPY